MKAIYEFIINALLGTFAVALVLLFAVGFIKIVFYMAVGEYLAIGFLVLLTVSILYGIGRYIREEF